MSEKPPIHTANLRRLASVGARWMAGARFVRVGAQFVQLLILARLLEPGDFGLMAMVTVVTSFGEAISDVGVGSAIIHFHEATRRQLSTLYWVNVLAGVFVFGVVQLVAPYAAGMFKEPEVIGLLRTASYMFLVMAVGQQFQFMLERDLKFRTLAVIEATATLVGAGVAITSAHGGKGVLSLVLGVIAFHATRSLLAAAEGMRRWRPSFLIALPECKPILRFGLYLVGERALNLGGRQLDKLILAILVDRETLGYYSLSYNLIGRAYTMINPIFTRVAYPVLARVKDDLARFQGGFLELMGVVSFLTMPLFAGIFVLAEPIVLVQFGAGYERCIPLLKIFCFLGALFSLGNPMGSLLLARGRADLTFGYNLARVGLYLVAVFVGSRWGVEGVAWALVFTTGGILHAAAFVLRWIAAEIRPIPYVMAIAPFAITALAGATVTSWLRSMGNVGNPVADLIVFGLLNFLLYGLILLVWRKERVRRILQMARS